MDINATLIGQLITFAILVWFTMKFVWPPITSAMHEREKKIAAGLEAAERAQRELQMAQHKVMEMLREARTESAALIEQAHKRATQIAEEARETAREESQRIVNRAEDDIQRQISETRESMRQQLASLAVAGAEKILRHRLDADAQTALLEEFVTEI